MRNLPLRDWQSNDYPRSGERRVARRAAPLFLVSTGEESQDRGMRETADSLRLRYRTRKSRRRAIHRAGIRAGAARGRADARSSVHSAGKRADFMNGGGGGGAAATEP